VPLHIRGGFLGENRLFISGLASGAAISPGLDECRQQVALMHAIETRTPRLVF
jgi:hypothetical protein